MDGSPNSATGSVWSRTPSPVPFPSISSLRSVQSDSSEARTKSSHLNYNATADQLSAAEHTVLPKSIADKTLTKEEIEAYAFFNNQNPKDILFGSLQEGKQLPPRIWNQPDYNFIFQLGDLDLGDKITMHYNDVRNETELDHTKVDRIA